MRLERGLTQRDVSRWLGMSAKAVANFERGRYMMHATKLYKLERYWAYADCRAMLIGGNRQTSRFPKAAQDRAWPSS